MTGDVESGGSGPTTGRNEGRRSSRNPDKRQESRSNAWQHYTGLESIVESPGMKMQDVDAASKLPPEADNGYLPLSSGSSTMTAGHKTRSFWEIDRTSSSWIHRLFNWLGASVSSSKKQLASRPLSAMRSQSDERSQEDKSSRDCEIEKLRPLNKPGRTQGDSWRPLVQRLSNLYHSSFGIERPESLGKEPEHPKSPPAEPQEEVQSKNKVHATSTNPVGNGKPLGGPSKGLISPARVYKPGSRKDICRQPYEPFPQKRPRIHHAYTKLDAANSNGKVVRYPKRTCSPQHVKKSRPVSFGVERQPSFALVEKYRCTKSEETTTASDHARPEKATFSRAASPLDTHHTEGDPQKNTEHSNDSGDLGDLDSDESEAHLESRHRSKRRRRSLEQQHGHPILSTYPETSSSLYSSSEATKSRQSSMISGGNARPASKASC